MVLVLEVSAKRRQITGANGTIGYACAAYALRQGYNVRCIVRSADAIEALSRGPSLQKFKDRIQYAIVHDNTILDAYDSVLSGVQYVIHVAGVWPTPVSTIAIIFACYVLHRWPS